jgi:TM2 domain-containing membrane protein YozV
MENNASKIRRKLNSILSKVKEKNRPAPRRADTVVDPEVTSTREIANKYRKLYTVIKDTESKLNNLNSAKDDLTEERYNELNKEYSEFLEKGGQLIDDTLKTIDAKLGSWFKEADTIEKNQNEIKSQIAQEEKLHQLGAISEEAYRNKISPLKSEEERLDDLYRSQAILIKILNDAKKNPLEPDDTIRTNGTGTGGDTSTPPPLSVNYKNPSIAVVLSFFIAGLGQIYNGEIAKGVLFIVVYFISGLLIWVVVGWITTPILWVWGMVDAYNSAEKINRSLSRR